MTASPYIIEITTENFNDIVIEGSHQVPVLVDFWAEWCQPCKMLMPVLASLADEYQGKFILAKLNTEEQQALAAQFGIRSIPTVKLFKNGEAIDEFMGALPESEIRRFLDPHLPRESDNLVAQAELLIQQGDLDNALQLLDQAETADPDNPRIKLAKIRLVAETGDFDKVETLINDLPMDQQDKPEIISLKARIPFAKALQNAPDIEQLIAQAASSSEAAYQLAAYKVTTEEYDTALQLLLELMKRDRTFGDDAARKAMVAIFDILGSENPLVGQYRSKMFNILH